MINTEIITTTTRWNTGSGKKLAPVAEKSRGMKKHHVAKKHHFTKTSKKHITPVGERVILRRASMIKNDRPLYPSAGNDYVNPYR